MRLNKKIVIITGASKGIGKVIAQRFIKEGAKVIVFGLHKPDFIVEFHKVDITKEKEIKKAMKEVKNLDVLINNAGMSFEGPTEKTELNKLNSIIDINFKGAFLMCKHSIPLLRKSKGNIINISSSMGLIAVPGLSAYCATKSALIMLTKCLSQEYAHEGIRTNVILPGPIDTPMLRSYFSSEKEFLDYANLNPMKHVGKPEEVANVAVFLASEEASFVNGGIYSVDGGESSSSLHSNQF